MAAHRTPSRSEKVMRPDRRYTDGELFRPGRIRKRTAPTTRATPAATRLARVALAARPIVSAAAANGIAGPPGSRNVEAPSALFRRSTGTAAAVPR